MFEKGQVAPAPPPPRALNDITRSWDGTEPVISVICPTFNHAMFVEDAISGFLAQETKVPFEILIRDDASTDATGDIIREYESRYNGIIRGIYEPENTWHRAIPLFELLPLARGRYIAMCEGDDYWLDPQKLQRQFEVLESNPQFSVSHHQSVKVQEGVVDSVSRVPPEDERELSAEEARRGPVSGNRTRFFRKVPLRPHPKARKFVGGDVWSGIQLGYFGGSIFQTDVLPAVYRVHSGGVWSRHDLVERKNVYATTRYFISWELAQMGDRDLALHWMKDGLSRYCHAVDGSYRELFGSQEGMEFKSFTEVLNENQELIEENRKLSSELEAIQKGIIWKLSGPFRRLARAWRRGVREIYR